MGLLYGRAGRALKHQKRWFLARAVGLSNAPRFLFLLPAAAARALAEFGATAWMPATAAALGAACLALNPSPHGVDLCIPGYAGFVVVFARATWLDHADGDLGEALRIRPDARSLLYAGLATATRRGLLLLAFCYCFAAPMLGLQEQGSCNMFSSLRMHGGSNHLLLPTGLLQRWLADDPRSSYGGGVVRVEATNSTYLTRTLRYPGEMSDRHPELARAYMAAMGHIGLQFYPSHWRTAPAAVSGLGNSTIGGYPVHEQEEAPGGPFVKYSLPAFELRRVMEEMRHRREDFELIYTRLPGAEGDETWRRGPGLEVVLRGDAEGGVSCLAAGRPCGEMELALLPPPSQTAGHLARKLLLMHPYSLHEGVAEQACRSP
jgi:hypothetical protein